MPRNNRVKKDVKPYNLRLVPDDYDKIQEVADKDGISMNTKLQFIVSDFLSSVNKKDSTPETGMLNSDENQMLKKIKNLPLKERQAFISKLIDDLSDSD